MKKQETKVSGTGTSIVGLIGVAFIVLKLCHVINWSWWLVTIPLWGGLALVVAILIIVVIAAVCSKD